MAPSVFIHHSVPPPDPHHLCNRTLLRTELRENVNAKLEEESGVEGARMRWTADGYAEEIVIALGLKLDNWPPDVPFANLSRIGGGVRRLEDLLRRWYAQDPAIAIRLVPSTPEDRANAAADPLSVHPNRQRVKPLKPVSISTAQIVYPRALHPGDLGSMGVHPTSTQPRAVESVHDKTERQQRSDVKRRRGRRVKLLTADGLPVVRPYPLPPKRGITSFRFILPESSLLARGGDGGGDRYFLVDDPIDEFLPDDVVSMADSRSSPSLEDDPIDEYPPDDAIGGASEVDEIECADGSWPGECSG
ncbi:hypothetical protein PYCCODRAFT_1462478 [Trametes coccinea BRFM310]|uniref:Uncharacterized protein n=1 Tax=Trametes coccinea (strain BRFM310) TaxID=1353009 RepID=A0A1Y2I567_TRAC3|nr:hypothetical protein PYCCODRAFT_1462478 [Trametes coccinea BRFM310]